MCNIASRIQGFMPCENSVVFRISYVALTLLLGCRNEDVIFRSEWPNICIRRITRETVPDSFALDKESSF